LFFLYAPVLAAASPRRARPRRAPLLRRAALLLSDTPRRSSPTRLSSPTRTQHRLLPPASSAAPTSNLPVPDVHLRPQRSCPPRRGGPPRLADLAGPPILGGDPSSPRRRPRAGPPLLGDDPSSPRRRPRAGPPLLGGDRVSALLLGGGLLQPVCRAAAAASDCLPPSVAAGWRACARWPAGARGVLPC
jgi:hypothetical protein